LRFDELARFAPTVTHWLPELRAAIDRHTTTVQLGRGQGYVLHNYRWLHGRRAFTGQRVMFRVHVDPLPHLGIPVGFRPTIITKAA
jgi:Taurine catabolism dioxygenase TauD, TfdA family